MISLLFGSIHGRIRIFDQRFQIRSVFRIYADAYAAGNEIFVSVNVKRQGQTHKDDFRSLLRFHGNREFTVFSPIPDFSLPNPEGSQLLPHASVKLPFVPARTEDPRIRPDDFCFRISRNLGKRRIYRQNRPLLISHQNAFRDVFQYDSCQQLARFRSFSFRDISEHHHHACNGPIIPSNRGRTIINRQFRSIACD